MDNENPQTPATSAVSVPAEPRPPAIRADTRLSATNLPPMPATRPALREENTIFVGKKPTMGYVLAVVTQFQTGAPWVKLKARGQIISKAVDVAEIVRHKFITDLRADSIRIDTEEVENEDGTKSKVSTLEIILKK
ncbi:DNA/RNA-binding protein Alba [uncultured archaeon]|nr:DNA/RNA-binding protein Alba [uncultured archaeon]